MAARRLLGGEAGLPCAPRLPLPASRPRAAAGEPTLPPPQPLAPRPAPRALGRRPRGASLGVAVRVPAARGMGCGRRSPEGTEASAWKGESFQGELGLLKRARGSAAAQPQVRSAPAASPASGNLKLPLVPENTSPPRRNSSQRESRTKATVLLGCSA